MVNIGELEVSNQNQFLLIAGPCTLESEEHAIMMSKKLAIIASQLGLDLIYKTSFDKANRTSVNSKRGVGIKQAIPIFDRLRHDIGVKVLTDVHSPEQCNQLLGHVDVLQIPAFLCRQTDLLIAAGNTGLPINVKKGQFLAPWDMKNVVEKIQSTGNNNVMLCERGTSFGYNTLINDMRSIPIMSEFGPVIFDATHSVQQPGGQGSTTGGQRQFVPTLAKAAIAIGVAGVFMETHEDPNNAPSDGPNMIQIDNMYQLLEDLLQIDMVIKNG